MHLQGLRAPEPEINCERISSTPPTLDLLVHWEPQIRRVYAILHDQSHVYEKMGALGVVAVIEAEERLRARFDTSML